MKITPILLVALVLAGCGTDHASTTPADTTRDIAATILDDEYPYVVFEHPDWELSEAVDRFAALGYVSEPVMVRGQRWSGPDLLSPPAVVS